MSLVCQCQCRVHHHSFVGSSIARGLRLYWGNDSENRDPSSFILDGSNDDGATWVNIVPQAGVAHNATRNGAASVAPNPFTQAMQEFDFYNNNTAYTSYRVTFPANYNSGEALTQIGEVESLGQSLNTAPPFFMVNLAPAKKAFVGASPASWWWRAALPPSNTNGTPTTPPLRARRRPA